MLRITRLTIAALCPIVVAGCTIDSLIDGSRYNKTDELMNRLLSSDVAAREEFQIDLDEFITRQIEILDSRMSASPRFAARAAPPTPVFCSDPQSTFAQLVQTIEVTVSPALARDRVFQAALATGTFTTPAAQRTMMATAEAPRRKLTFADFENFRRTITDASASSARTLEFAGTARQALSNTRSTVFSDLFVNNEIARGMALARGKKSPFASYVGAYYRGTFIDRFGEGLEKPSFKNGIEDGTIANFARVLIELGLDSDKRKPILTGASGYLPKKDKEPTYHKVFGLKQPAAKTGGAGVSEKEFKLILSGANLLADQGLTLFSGALEFLGGIDIGLVVLPNFTIGSNNTLKTLARTVIETSLRRGGERALFCLMEKYDFDALADAMAD
jgi:hypothetical protein